MTNNEYPRLCGGTFFTLLLQDLRQRYKAREHYKGERDGLSDPEVLIGLIRIIKPDYQEPREGMLKSKANDYKSCKTSKGKYLPLGNNPAVEEFDIRVQTEFASVLREMISFVDAFLETGASDKRDLKLARALVDLILKDKSIEDDEEFYIGEHGEKIKKAALGDLDKVCLPAFLLGVWHYAVVNRKDNKVGQATYDKWCPPTGGGPREYSGDMGKMLQRPQCVYLITSAGEPDTENIIEPEIIEFSPESEKEKTPPPGAQSVYNDHPVFVSQQGDGNAVISNYGTINLTLGKH